MQVPANVMNDVQKTMPNVAQVRVLTAKDRASSVDKTVVFILDSD